MGWMSGVTKLNGIRNERIIIKMGEISNNVQESRLKVV